MLSVSKDQFYGWVLLTSGGNKVTSDGKILCFKTSEQAKLACDAKNKEMADQLSQGKCDGQLYSKC